MRLPPLGRAPAGVLAELPLLRQAPAPEVTGTLGAQLCRCGHIRDLHSGRREDDYLCTVEGCTCTGFKRGHAGVTQADRTYRGPQSGRRARPGR